jgi:GNAT superfamily N-acetyltransferase
MSNFHTTFVTDRDKPEWRALFDGYAEYYGVQMNDSIANAVWGWLLDPNHVLEGLLTRTDAGSAVGIAHVRAIPHPLSGNEVGFLDDMYVAVNARGSGAADAIFERLQDLAQERGWSAIRWITQHSNARGRAFYDRYTSGPTDFIMYQWKQ